MNIWGAILNFFGWGSPAPAPAAPPQWQIGGLFDGKTAVVGAGPNYGGAIYSLTWGGQQLINQDPAHGGQIQTAYYLEGSPAINPTEAGNWTDTTGSTTQITGEYFSSVHLQTICHPAYWSGPYQGSRVSPDNLGKTVSLAQNIIDLQYTLEFKGDHPSCGLETCWYLPFNFTSWFGMNGEKYFAPAKTSMDSDVPIIAATLDGSLACAIYCTAPQNKVFGWGFDQQYPKINVYFPNLGVIKNGDKFAWEVYAVFGTLAQVQTALKMMTGAAIVAVV